MGFGIAEYRSIPEEYYLFYGFLPGFEVKNGVLQSGAFVGAIDGDPETQLWLNLATISFDGSDFLPSVSLKNTTDASLSFESLLSDMQWSITQRIDETGPQSVPESGSLIFEPCN